MTPNDQPRRRQRRTFRYFLAGAGLGVLFGVLTPHLYPAVKGYREQIWIGFCGLIGGLAGLLSGFGRWLGSMRSGSQ